MKSFVFEHNRGKRDAGFVFGFRLWNYFCLAWIGYGRPAWWKPRILFPSCGELKNFGRRRGIGFGWLLLSFQVNIINIRKFRESEGV